MKKTALGRFMGLGNKNLIDVDAFVLYQSKRENGLIKDSVGGFGLRFETTSGICVLPGVLCYKYIFDVQLAEPQLLRRCDRFAEVYSEFPPGKVLAVRGERRGSGAGGFFVGNTGIITFAIHQSESKYLVRFTTGCNILGIPIDECTVFVGNFPESLFLQVNLFSKIFGLFKAEIDVKAVLPSNLLSGFGWLNMPIRIRARVFDFSAEMVKGVVKIVQDLVDAVLERLEAFENVVKDWEKKLDDANRQLRKIEANIDKLEGIFDSAIDFLDGVTRTLEAVKRPLEDARDAIDDIIRKLDRMCKITKCNPICIPGCGCCRCRRRRGSEDFGLIEHKSFSKTTLLLNKPAAQKLLVRNRRGWGCIPLPYCSSCMWKIPNIPCIIKNLICQALRIPIIILLRIVQAAISALLAAVDAAQKIVDLAKAVVDKLRFLVDIASK